MREEKSCYKCKYAHKHKDGTFTGKCLNEYYVYARENFKSTGRSRRYCKWYEPIK